MSVNDDSVIHDVFLSHSHRDEARTQELAALLREWEIDVFVDVDDAMLAQLPDMELPDRLVGKLRRCRVLLFAFSEDAVDSRWMPWELGLAHGVVGRVLLWPFTERALQAKERQEYLHLYEALDPRDPAAARTVLKGIIAMARWSSITPADAEKMGDLAANTVNALPDFGNPAVAWEYVVRGPSRLYTAWFDALMGRRRAR